MPTYLTFAELEEEVGGEDALALIADPTFANGGADETLVNLQIEYAEGELLRLCRAAPTASGLPSWVATPAALPVQAKGIIVSLAVHRIHEVVRATQGYSIPKGVIDAKTAAYKSLEGLADGSVSWSSSAAPAATLTQKVRVHTDPNARGRRALSRNVRKIIQ